ncbi:tail fiber protein [Brevundimonas nasdae]|uniref:tail fiber protein n=1 Tax=Brevundimonas nasdae TaxID=172043 RepID=UPI003F68CD30
MSILQLVITQVGRAALVNAEATGTNAVVIAQVGVTPSVFVAADTLTALPGELKRISTIAGEPTAPDRMNLVLRDDDEVAYAMRGFGLYLDTGELFAAYSSPQVIIEKSALASLLTTMDIAFTTAVAPLIQFGDMSWTNPAATTTRKGVAELATDEETVAGSDTERVVTPKGVLAAIQHFANNTLAVLLGLKADRARTISGGGLATGGGDLSADRTITVTEASAAEALAGTSGSVVITPRRAKAMFDALVAGAPGALDTLDELAAALGDDANFAATMTNQLALKAPLNSPGLTGAPTAPTPGGGDPGTRISTKAYVDTAVATVVGLVDQLKDDRRGDIVFRATQTVPAGAYECDGRAVSRTGDAALFARIGTAYGAGNGSTTFNIPDMRGEFARGWDNGRGVDPGRIFGSNQADEFRSHDHSIPSRDNADAGDGWVEDAGPANSIRNTRTGSTGGTETRPRSVAGMYIIWR